MRIYSKIIGTGSDLPEKILTNADLEKMVDTDDQWIQDRTGIKQRHVAGEGETTSTMGLKAAHKALEAAGITADDIDLIVVGTHGIIYCCCILLVVAVLNLFFFLFMLFLETIEQ